MTSSRLRLVRYAAAGLCLAATLAFHPASATTLVAGSDSGPQIHLDFTDPSGDGGVTIRTERVGVAGSRLRVLVDSSPTPLFEHLFGEDECRFGDGGSECTLRLRQGDAGFERIVEGFKAGLVGHVTIDDAGAMRMDERVSLRGFTRSYDG